MSKFCGSCSYNDSFCVTYKKKCQDCFFETDDNGKKTKPNYKKKFSDRLYRQLNYDPGAGNGRTLRRGGSKRFSNERKIAIANDPRLAIIVASENKITPSWVYNLRRKYKSPVE